MSLGSSGAALLLATEEGGHEINPILPAIPELILGIIVFGILFFFIAKKVVPAFEKVYAERRAAIEGGMEKATAAQREAEQALQQYRAQLAEARSEAARIVEDARSQGQAILEELRVQAQQEADRIRLRGEEQLRGERQQVVAQLRGEIGRLSMDLAERIVGESLDAQRQSGVVDRFLAELETQPGGAGATSPVAGR